MQYVQCKQNAQRTYLVTPLDIGRLREVHVIDSVHHILRRDHAAAEVTAIQAANSVLSALDTVELDVDFAIVVVESEADVHDHAVLLVALFSDILFELLLPVLRGLPKSAQ